MRLGGRRESENVRDVRGMSRTKVAGGGIGAIVIAAIMAYLVSGGDLQKAMQAGKQKQQAAQRQAQAQPQQGGTKADPNDPVRVFLAKVLGGTEDIWAQQFKARGLTYKAPILNIFEGTVDTKCGRATSAVGPFYCPGDQEVYIDPSFFNDLATKHDTEGDFAYAYVIAHEVGHHVQNLLGFSAKVSKIRRGGDKIATNRASVRLELQADFLAGVWAHHDHKNFDSLDDSDVDEALNAAYQIGDDTLQKKAQGYAVPEHFTHGTSAQRVKWFRAGLESGDFEKCQLAFDIPYEDL